MLLTHASPFISLAQCEYSHKFTVLSVHKCFPAVHLKNKNKWTSKPPKIKKEKREVGRWAGQVDRREKEREIGLNKQIWVGEVTKEREVFFLSVEREKPRVTAMDGESPMNICGQRHHA